jgi:hypothetical protein
MVVHLVLEDTSWGVTKEFGTLTNFVTSCSVDLNANPFKRECLVCGGAGRPSARRRYGLGGKDSARSTPV